MNEIALGALIGDFTVFGRSDRQALRRQLPQNTAAGRASSRPLAQIPAHRSSGMLILSVVVRAMKPSKITTPKFGSFESMPAIFNDAEAWVLFGGTWRELGPFEVSFGAGLMTKRNFERTYSRLPALPAHAFAQ